MVHIQVSDSVKVKIDIQRLEAAIFRTLDYTGHSKEKEVTLVLTDDRQLNDLNYEFMGIDAPTDVLSFPADFIDPDSQHEYLGDILISVPRAIEQANTHQRSLLSEILLLTVHGTLHLLGFDHAEKEDSERMWLAQENILSQLEKD